MNRREQLKIARYLSGDLSDAMDEAVAKDGIEVRKNEFGETATVLGDDHYIVDTLKRICMDVQIDPLYDEPKIDRVKLDEVALIDDSHIVVKFWGGANGGRQENKLQSYLMVVRKLVDMIQKKFDAKVWMVDWKNDCCDDVWYVRLGFVPGSDDRWRMT